MLTRVISLLFPWASQQRASRAGCLHVAALRTGQSFELSPKFQAALQGDVLTELTNLVLA